MIALKNNNSIAYYPCIHSLIHFTITLLTDEYIYCPWMAPIEIQLAAGCRIGINYPNPIVDHATAGFLCCEKLRSVMDMVRKGSSSSSSKIMAAVNHSRRSHATNCSSIIQTHLGRFHPYSRLENGGGADENNRGNHLGLMHHNQHHRHGGNANTGVAHCTICTSTDNVLTQVLCSTRSQERVVVSRSRRRSPPLLCSHKQSDFAVIT